MREAEKKVADYRATTDLQRTGQDQTFAGQQLTNVSAELTRVQAELANANARAEAVRQALKSGGPVDTIADVISSPTIQQLKAQEAQIQNQISDLSMSLLDGHPRLKGLRAQLAGIREQINVETRKILKSLENEAEVAKLRQSQLGAQLNKAKTASARADDQQVGLNALEREAAAQRDLLQTYLARYREASSRAGKDAAPADARVISTAVVPTEIYFPKVVPIVTVAALAAFLLSARVHHARRAVQRSRLENGHARRRICRSPGSGRYAGGSCASVSTAQAGSVPQGWHQARVEPRRDTCSPGCNES